MSRRPGVDYAKADDCALGESKQAIDAWGTKVARWCDYDVGGKVSAVVAKLGGRIHYEDTLESPEGGTIFIHGPQDFDILLPTWTSPQRDQFTLAHELGHYFLHSNLGKVPLVANRSGTGRSEWEANWFAAGFLMPADEFRKQVQAGEPVDVLFQTFAVSPRAVEIRKQSLGL